MDKYPTALFLKPRYDSGGFASLPQRLADLLTVRRYDAVVLFLIDGFGWRSFDKFQDAPFLKQVTREGAVEKLTAQFPSTTAAHITTIHTGQAVGEHGIFEWNYYEPMLDAVIAPLLFSFAGTVERDTLKQVAARPKAIYPKPTIYNTLADHGVKSTIFQHREYTPSTYSNAMFKGAQAFGYRTLPEGLVNLGEAMAKANSPAYYYLYYEKIDNVSHDYGPDAPQTTAEIQSVLLTMEHIFKNVVRPKGKTLFMLTADHGQSEVDPQTTIYLNTDPRFAGVMDFLRTDRTGNPIVPGGACRDFFLYVKDGMVDEAQAFLASRLEGRAEVRKVAEMVEAGWFGPKVSPTFRARAGDLVILPYRGEAVWWYEKDKFFQKYYGHHGGLTPQEMEIPLMLWEM
ncbi:MAG: nucleotide pyrophosphatase/phosphodiesterase family protein [Chloroflexota bacterium]